MKTIILPETSLGKKSIFHFIFAIVLIAGMIIYNDIIEPESTGEFFGNMPMALMVIGAFISAGISLLTGIVALIMLKERSILFFTFFVFSVLFLYFGFAQSIGEIISF